MNLPIAGYLKTTLIDWPGKIASVVFIAGCNFRCGFCHNPELVTVDPNMETISPEDIYQDLRRRAKWIDGISITGGEPTLYSDLVEFIEGVKKAGFEVKLDTNGTNFKMLKYLIDEDLVDYVAMDIKAPLEDYRRTIGVEKFDEDSVKRSVCLLLKDKVDYEFRTTMVPDLIGKEEMKKINLWIKGAKRYYIQPFRPLKTLDSEFTKKRTYLKGELKELLKIAKPYVKQAEIRGI